MGPDGFTWVLRKSGEVVVHHDGRPAANLRGAAAARFLKVADTGDEVAVQNALARLTGNYKRGNERDGKARRG